MQARLLARLGALHASYCPGGLALATALPFQVVLAAVAAAVVAAQGRMRDLCGTTNRLAWWLVM